MSTRASGWLPRAALFLAAAGTLLLLVEGGLSLLGGTSLRHLLHPARPSATDPARLYRADPDPLVGYTLFTNATLQVFDGVIHTDALGMRRAPDGAGDADGADGPVIAVLGDSVAFGFGLDDDEVLAARLEALLDASRGPRVPHVRCRTVATPGWNHRNAVHFLLDHLDAIHPDLVLYMPISNDLLDTDAVNEEGQRRIVPDPAEPEPWLAANLSGQWHRLEAQAALGSAATREAFVAQVGPGALGLDLSPESSRRFDENAASIRLLQRVLAARGCPLLLLQYQECDYVWHLSRRLDAESPAIPVIPLLSEVGAAMMLPHDAHPNAATHDALARWIAAELLAGGWLDPGEGLPIEPPGEPFRSARAPRRTAEEIAALSRAWRSQSRHHLKARIDFQNLDGIAQIFGGVNEDGSVGTSLKALLARDGEELLVRLAPLPGRADLSPLDVSVDVDGVPVGVLRVTADGPVEQTFALPPSERDTLEVRLVPERWVTLGAGVQARVASCVPLLLASRP